MTGCTTASGNQQELIQATATPQQLQATKTPAPAQSTEAVPLRVITQDLAWPLEVLYGPDGFLWVTERVGKRVTRIKPDSGEQRVALTISEVYQSDAQDGLLSMVFHPELLQGTGNDYIYLAYIYLAEPVAVDEEAEATDSGGIAAASPASTLNRRVKISRYTYDPEKESLLEPVELLTNLPGSNDHNSGRLVFSPDGTLFYAIGDQGNNQFNRACLPNLAQVLPAAEEIEASDWSNYPGKILRLNLDGSIPEDNPIINGVQSHIYSYGHRNVQGLAFSPEGQLYASEHGPKSDDEINLILPGKNYGWPHVAGYQDDQGYIYGNWSAAEDCQSLTFSDFELPDSVPVQKESEWTDPNFVPPIYTFGTVGNDYDFKPAECAPLEYICWPTVAPTGLEVYAGASGKGPDWPTSLLVTALKTGTVYRLALNQDGTAVVGEAVPLFKTTNRYRDLSIAPDASLFYVITDSGSNTQDPSGLPTKSLEHPGSILEFSYTGSD